MVMPYFWNKTLWYELKIVDDIKNVPLPSQRDMNDDEDTEVETNKPPSSLLELALIGIYQ